MLPLAVPQILLLGFLVNVVWSYLRHHRKEMPLLSTLGHDQIPEGVLVIVPAKDEEAGIGGCLERLAALRGLDRHKVIAVDDRSADSTRLRMLEQSRIFPGVVVTVPITELPAGWLGKNHACWQGAQAGLQVMPEAEYLLFTDGDVRFHPDTLAESITWMKRRGIDFMTLIEDAEFEGVLEPAYLLLFGILLVFFSARPWLLQRPGGRNFMGNGAYLLIRREAYERTGGHRALRLEVVEDLRMGLLMRSRGFRCATAVGLGRIFRRWQPGFTGIFRGLLKNSFAAFDYSVPLVLAGVLFFPFVFLGPWALLFAGGWKAWLGAANLGMVGLCFWLASRNSRLPWLSGFALSPFTSLAASLNLAASAAKVILEGGVSWRGTLYPLSELRANCLTSRKAFMHPRAEWSAET